MTVEGWEPAGRAIPIFAYGTLKPDGVYYGRVSAWVVYTEDATVRGELFDTGMGYPAAVFNDAGLIQGVLLYVPAPSIDQVIAVMDEVEAEGREYRRVRVHTMEGVEAIAYEWMGPTDLLRPLLGPWT